MLPQHLLNTSAPRCNLCLGVSVGYGADIGAAPMDHFLKQPARLERLHVLARQMREAAIDRSEDLEGWRIARLLRDAETPAQADEAERQLHIWEAQAK